MLCYAMLQVWADPYQEAIFVEDSNDDVLWWSLAWARAFEVTHSIA